MYPVYKCLDCGAEFTEPDKRTEYEHHSELAGMPGPKDKEYTIESCPDCGSENIDGGWWCECCGERWADDDFCEDCYNRAADAAVALQHSMNTDWSTIVDLFGKWSERNW